MIFSTDKRITGIGSALVDMLVPAEDSFLKQLGKEKGGMTLVTDSQMAGILALTPTNPAIVPGGAACNTLMGIGMLGGTARFIGRRGDDTTGDLFEEHLRSCRVEPILSRSPSPTGKVLSVITPDAQRSMFTFLGAATEMTPERITPDLFADTTIAMIEGYLTFNPDLLTAVLAVAHGSGAQVALDLASFEVVTTFKPLLRKLIRDHVDILIANEDEARAYTGQEDPDAALRALSESVSIAVLKLGKNGSRIAFRGDIFRIPAVTGKAALDTTGAGDLWAAGFLFGLARGLSIEASGALGSACGYEVCQVMGARIPEAGWQRIRALIPSA